MLSQYSCGYVYTLMYNVHRSNRVLIMINLPLSLSVDLVTEGHDEFPVLIAVLGVGGLL